MACNIFPRSMSQLVPRYVRGVARVALLHAPDLSVHRLTGGIVDDVNGKITLIGA